MTITGLLGVVFVVLKLTHYIDWSWWWVLAPFWGAFAIWFATFFVLALAAAMPGVRMRR